MRTIRDRADARWLPSRHRFALFRLIAYFRLRGMPAEEKPGLVLSVDRDQNAIDHYIFSVLIAILTISYVAAALMLIMHPIVAIVIALAVTGFIAQIPMYILGGSLTIVGKLFGAPGENHLRIQHTVLGGLLIASACWTATLQSWLRFVAWGFLACMAVNAVAFIFVLLLGRRIAGLESRFGVET